MDRVRSATTDFALRHPLAAGIATIAAVGAAGAWFSVRAYQLSFISGPLWPVVGAMFGLIAVAVWLNGGLRHNYRLTTAEWVVTVGGQIASVVSVVLLFAEHVDAHWQSAGAGYLGALFLGLTPGLYVGNRRVRRDPKRGPIGAIRATEALLGRRRRRE